MIGLRRSLLMCLGMGLLLTTGCKEERPDHTRPANPPRAAGLTKPAAGQQSADLIQRMRALRGFMREERLGWREVPDDIKQDLAERALPMIDTAQKQMAGLAEALGKSLGPEQRERLRRAGGHVRKAL